MEITKSYLKDLIYKVNAAAIEVHKYTGPGLLESVYHKCMKHELSERGIKYISELQVPEGLLLNFNVSNLFKEGQRTYVNEIYRDLPN